MPFEYALSPVIVQLGPFALRWYSLVYVLAFVAAYYWLRRSGFAKEKAESFITWAILGVVLGGRLFYVLAYNPSYYLAEPLKVFAVWEGGMAFHGALLGVALATWLWARRNGTAFYALADLLAAPAALFLALGRVANLVNGELPGTVTSVSWCINYPDLDGCRHPYQVYAALKNLAVFGVLAAMTSWEALKKRLAPGTVFWSFVFLYGAGRLAVDAWRAPDPTDPVLGGLLLGQWFSIIMVLVAGRFLISGRSNK